MPPPSIQRRRRKDLPRPLNIRQDLNVIPSPSSSGRRAPPPPGYLRKKLAEADAYATKERPKKPTVTSYEATCMVAVRNEEIRLSKEAASALARRKAAKGRSGRSPSLAALAAAKAFAPPPRHPRPRRDGRNDDGPADRSPSTRPRPPPPRNPEVGHGGHPPQRYHLGAAAADAGRQGSSHGRGKPRSDPPPPQPPPPPPQPPAPAQPQVRAVDVDARQDSNRGRKRVHFAD